MKKTNKHFRGTTIYILVILGLLSTTGMAQPKPYYGPLHYSAPWQTTLPPIDTTEPLQVTTGFLWLDDVMRIYPELTTENFFNSLSWGDTMKTLASVLYQAQDYNPLATFLWSGNGVTPNPYKGSPSRAQAVFEQHVAQIAGDTGRTASLLKADIISDVLVSDTFCVIDPTAYSAFNMVLVNSTILDEIKGKKVPLCVGSDMRAHRKKGVTPQSSGTIPWETYPVPADTGGCIQFEYSPSWWREPTDDGPKDVDSVGGWWVKPGIEYIVLLNFSGLQADSSYEYFTLNPGPANPPFGSSGCMYPVINGIVQDPYDDFRLGAPNLPVAVWKARLRAYINKIINP